MLKGCTKKVIFVKLPENPVYEEAFFVVRAGVTAVKEDGDFLNEARKIINGSHIDTSARRTKKSHAALCNFLFFLCGAVVSFAAAAFLLGLGTAA